MNQEEFKRLKTELGQIANKAIDLRWQLGILEAEADKALSQSLTDDSTKACMKPIKEMPTPEKDKICCVSGPMTYEFSQEQYNYILSMMGGSFGGNTGKVIEKLIKDGQCFVNHKDVSITPEVLQYIKIELDPNSVGCYKYTFNLENFLATPYFQNKLKYQLDYLQKTILESTRIFNELAYLK